MQYADTSDKKYLGNFVIKSKMIAIGTIEKYKIAIVAAIFSETLLLQIH